MKKIFAFLFLTSLLVLTFYYKEDITNYVIDNFIYKKECSTPTSNEYTRNYDFEFVQRTNNFYPNNKQELYNVFYTILNNGDTNFTFYCGEEYVDCAKDIEEITATDNEILATINNYVHPFNSYNSISVNMNNFGRITVDITKLYDDYEINVLNNFIEVTYKNIVNDNMTTEQKVKAIHNYIINNSVYDKSWTTTAVDERIHRSNIAYGPLIEHIGLCGGYTDAMELYLEKLNIKSYKIASENHIWNYILMDNNWKHLDLTWDDPVTNTGKNILQHEYYLLDTKALENKKDNEHIYNKNLYLEAK